MIRLTDLTGLASVLLMFVAAIVAITSSLQAWRMRRQQSTSSDTHDAVRSAASQRAWLLAIALLSTVVLCLPWHGMPLVAYPRALTGDLSIVLVVLLLRGLLRRLARVSVINAAPELADRWVLHTSIAGAAMLLYPASLQIGAFDPYRWGFGSFVFLAALLVYCLAAWHRALYLSATVVSLAVLAWAVGWYESSNLWTYLLDPMLAVYAAGAMIVSALRAARFRWHSLALILAALAWLFLGLLGREPWKADEAYSFGIVYSILEEQRWLVPTLAGEPFVEKPPLVFWLAALCASAVSALMPLAPFSWIPAELALAAHEAARLANVVIVLTTAAILAWAAIRAGLGRIGMVSVVVLLAGTPSFLLFTRYLTADMGLLAGAAFACLGLVALLRGDRDTGVWLGVAAATGLLSKGLLLPAVLAFSCFLLSALNPKARSTATLKHYGIALLVFLLLGGAWPLALYSHDPQLFHIWIWDNNFGRFLGYNRLGPPADRWNLLAGMLAALLPLWPLALITVFRKRRALFSDPLLGPLLFGLCWLGVLLISSSSRTGYALPAAVPLSLVAAAALAAPAPWVNRWLHENVWPRRLLFAVGVLALSLVAAAKLFYVLTRPASALGSSKISLLALSFTALLLFCAGMALRGGKPARLAVLWAGTVTAVFALAIALFLPGADKKSGFRGVFGEAAIRLNPHAGCVASLALGESERGMLHYYTGVQTLRFEVDEAKARECPQWLEQQRRIDQAEKFGCKGGREVWRGGRPENTFDVFRVCKRE